MALKRKREPPELRHPTQTHAVQENIREAGGLFLHRGIAKCQAGIQTAEPLAKRKPGHSLSHVAL